MGNSAILTGSLFAENREEDFPKISTIEEKAIGVSPWGEVLSE
jgi:hypothetical protein